MTRKDILKILSNCDFSQNLHMDNFSDMVLQKLPTKERFNFTYEYGATKLVLLPKNAKFVIKIPFNGILETDYSEGAWRQDRFYEYENACCDDLHAWDYCVAEMLIYRAAKQQHVERAFCKTAYIGSVNNYPIYIQERAITYEDYKKEMKDNFWKDWCNNAIDYYGKRQFLKINDFIEENEIEDLHKNNIGYIGKRPVLIDYSSWRS